MKNTIFLLLFLPVLILSCGGTQKTSSRTAVKKSGVQFERSSGLAKVLEKAQGQNKLVFLDFYTSWCMPCKMMDEDVFSNNDIGLYFNRNFINYKVNAEKGNGPDLAAKYEVRVYPTLLFLDANGNVLERKEGAAYHTELRRLADSALSGRHNGQSSR